MSINTLNPNFSAMRARFEKFSNEEKIVPDVALEKQPEITLTSSCKIAQGKVDKQMKTKMIF